jgi:hypothetical protein
LCRQNTKLKSFPCCKQSHRPWHRGINPCGTTPFLVDLARLPPPKLPKCLP